MSTIFDVIFAVVMGIITIGGSSMRQIAISEGRIGRVNGLTVLLSIASWFSVSFIAKGMLWPYVAFCLSGGYFLHRMAADKARELARRERSKVRRAAGILLINDDGTFQGVPQDDGTYALPVVLLEPAEDTIAGAHRAASKELGLRVELLGLPLFSRYEPVGKTTVTIYAAVATEIVVPDGPLLMLPPSERVTRERLEQGKYGCFNTAMFRFWEASIGGRAEPNSKRVADSR